MTENSSNLNWTCLKEKQPETKNLQRKQNIIKQKLLPPTKINYSVKKERENGRE